MNINCPLCGAEAEIEVDLVEGQHVICPSCGRKFSYHATDGSAGREQYDTEASKNKAVSKSGYIARAWKVVKRIWGNMSRLDCGALVVVFASVVIYCLATLSHSIFTGGHYWFVDYEPSSNTNEMVWKISVAKNAMQGWTGKRSIGCLVVVYEDSRDVCLYRAQDEKDEYCHIWRSEDIYTEKGWEDLKVRIHNCIKYETAKEIINYIDTLR